MKASSRKSKKTEKTACSNRKEKPDALKWAEKFEAFTTRPEFVEWVFNVNQINQNFLHQLRADNFIADAIVRKLFSEYPLRLKANSRRKRELCFTCLKEIDDYLRRAGKKEPDRPSVPMFTGIDEGEITKLCDQIIQDNQKEVECPPKYKFLSMLLKQLTQSKKNAFLHLLKGSLIVRTRYEYYFVRNHLRDFSETVIDQDLREFYLALGTAWTMLNDAEKAQIVKEADEYRSELNRVKPQIGNRNGGRKTPTEADFEVLADIIADVIKSKKVSWEGYRGKQSFRDYCINCWIAEYYWPPSDEDRESTAKQDEYVRKVENMFKGETGTSNTRQKYFRKALTVLFNRNDSEIHEAVKSIAKGYPNLIKEFKLKK